jgi:starch synthase
VTTVSPRYAQEIRTPEFGNGMDGVITTRLDDLHGILNGIDTAVWNPAVDASLPARFSAGNIAGKVLCRAKLLQEFNWDQKYKGPIFGMVCRFVAGKGLDLVLGAAGFFAQQD